jgi:hypothetical protein
MFIKRHARRLLNPNATDVAGVGNFANFTAVSGGTCVEVFKASDAVLQALSVEPSAELSVDLSVDLSALRQQGRRQSHTSVLHQRVGR